MNITKIPTIKKPITKTARTIRIRACAKGLIYSKKTEEIEALKKALLELEPNPRIELKVMTTYSVEVSGVCIRLLKDKEEAANLTINLTNILESINEK